MDSGIPALGEAPVSEHQSYEFLAVDRRLSAEEMTELRRCSTRARITPTTFTNSYQWGSFKGNEDLWMEKYFDVYAYWANWGTRIVKIKVAAADLDAAEAQPFLAEAAARKREAHIQSLAGREDDLWEIIEECLADKKKRLYAAIVELLTDLRDMDARWPGTGFRTRLAHLRERHAGKKTLLRMIEEAGM